MAARLYQMAVRHYEISTHFIMKTSSCMLELDSRLSNGSKQFQLIA